MSGHYAHVFSFNHFWLEDFRLQLFTNLCSTFPQFYGFFPFRYSPDIEKIVCFPVWAIVVTNRAVELRNSIWELDKDKPYLPPWKWKFIQPVFSQTEYNLNSFILPQIASCCCTHKHRVFIAVEHGLTFLIPDSWTNQRDAFCRSLQFSYALHIWPGKFTVPHPNPARPIVNKQSFHRRKSGKLPQSVNQRFKLFLKCHHLITRTTTLRWNSIIRKSSNILESWAELASSGFPCDCAELSVNSLVAQTHIAGFSQPM